MSPKEPEWKRLLQADGFAFWAVKHGHGTLWFQPKSWGNRVFRSDDLASAAERPPAMTDLDGPWAQHLTPDGRAFWRQDSASGIAYYQPADWSGKTFGSLADLDAFEARHDHMPLPPTQNYGVSLAHIHRDGERVSGTAASDSPTVASTEQCPPNGPCPTPTPNARDIPDVLIVSGIILAGLVLLSILSPKRRRD